MDNDVTIPTPGTSRQSRRRRRLIAVGVAAVAIVAAVVVGGALRQSTAGTSGALGATACPTKDQYNRPVPPAAPESNWHGCNLDGFDLVGANLFGSDLAAASMTSADLRGANFAWSSMEGVKLQNSDLSGANFTYAYLSNANFKGSNTTKLIMANFTGAHVEGAIFTYSDLSYATLYRAVRSSTTVWGAYDTWTGTTCVDGSLSSAHAGTCPLT